MTDQFDCTVCRRKTNAVVVCGNCQFALRGYVERLEGLLRRTLPYLPEDEPDLTIVIDKLVGGIVCAQADEQAVSRLREDMMLVLEAVTQADPGQPHVEFANIECIAARALGVESEVWT